jgi:hypothetical protein
MLLNDPPPPWRPELVVITCGSRKLDHRAPAGELYTGTYHRACRRAAEALEPERLLILSSAYGLLRLDDIIDPYDTAVDDPDSITAAQLIVQAEERGVLSLDPVVVFAGARHVRLAHAVWPHAMSPLAGIGGMGKHIAYMNALSRGAA